MNTVPQMLDFTFRVVVLVLAMTIGVMFVIAGARNALAATLKPTAIITENVFTVGDIFGGLSQEMADKVLGPAPQPGQDMVLNARTLMRIATALDLPWQPSSSLEQVVVRRAATLVSSDEIRNAVRNSLKEKGLEENYELTFVSMPNPQIILPHGESAAVEVTAINYDAQQGRFEATLASPSKQNPLAELAVTGKIERLVPVPVLKRTMASGDIINAYDIAWTDMKSSELQHDIILDAEGIIGMTPRRMLDSGKPVRSLELERPQLVTRGDTITITYLDGPMVLTAQGKAMQNGAKGDMIRVVNTGSNRTVDAFVEDQYVVTVTP